MSWPASFGQSSFATYAVVHEHGVIKVPADLPAEAAAPLGCSARTGAGTVLNRLRPEPGSSLVVLGAGGVGLSAVMAAVAVGCDPVVAVGPVPSRRTLATELGAEAAPAPGDGLVAALRDLTGGGAPRRGDHRAPGDGPRGRRRAAPTWRRCLPGRV